MSPLIAAISWFLVALPLVFVWLALRGRPTLLVPALVLVGVGLWVWLRFRPSEFVVHPETLEVRWPLKRRELARSEFTSVRRMRPRDLREEIGWGMRVGAGGLWGGFGWLWTRRRGVVQMYVSRTDDFVWIERSSGRPWLITPMAPDAFVRALGGDDRGASPAPRPR